MNNENIFFKISRGNGTIIDKNVHVAFAFSLKDEKSSNLTLSCTRCIFV